MKIYIKPEQLTYFIELVGYEKIDKMEFYGITEDDQLETISLDSITEFLNTMNNKD